jgi:hypothetical protein
MKKKATRGATVRRSMEAASGCSTGGYTVFFHHLVKVAALESHFFSGPADIPVVVFKRREDELLFDVGHRLLPDFLFGLL